MEMWRYLYENTTLSTREIEKTLDLVKDSVRQKARAIYPDDYRKDREIRVRNWPRENSKWVELYEKTTLTHEQIAKATEMSVKQIFTRVRDNYSEKFRNERKFKTKSIAQTEKQKRIRERATTISRESTD